MYFKISIYTNHFTGSACKRILSSSMHSSLTSKPSTEWCKNASDWIKVACRASPFAKKSSEYCKKWKKVPGIILFYSRQMIKTFQDSRHPLTLSWVLWEKKKTDTVVHGTLGELYQWIMARRFLKAYTKMFLCLCQNLLGVWKI